MKHLLQAIRDENRSVHERMFILLAAIALTAMFVVFIVELIIDNTKNNAVMVGIAFIVFLPMVYFGIKSGKFNLLASLIAVIIILGLLPVSFFFGGGIHGGSPVWFVFCALFINLIVYGKIKRFFLLLEGAVAAACFIVAYENPELVTEHSTRTFYIGTFVSMIIVGLILSLMVGFEIRMLRREKERSEEKTDRRAEQKSEQVLFQHEPRDKNAHQHHNRSQRNDTA